MRTTSHKTVRIYTNRGTHCDGCNWSNMRYGYHVQARAKRSHGRWIASQMRNWNQWGNDGWGNMPGWSHGGWGGPMMGGPEM